MKTLEQTPNSGRIFLVLTIGFFVGIFISTLDVSASTLFLDNFDAQTTLPKAIFIAGLLGVMFTYLFAFFQNRLAFFSVSALFICIILFIITTIRLSFGAVADNNLLIFCLFIFIGPVNAVVFLIFWGVYGRLFNLRESKRLIGRIDSGQLLASIVSLFTIPLVLNFIHDPANLLWISCSSIGIIFLLLIIAKGQYNLDYVNTQKVTSTRKNHFSALIRSKYIVLMAVFVNISMVCIFLANYSFLAVTADQFQDPRHLANFISVYSGTIVVFNFLIQNFVTDRLINMYGLKVSLLINPILFCLFTILSAIIGTYLGYTKESETFLVFFMAIALGKLFATSLKDALDSPTFKLYFLPLDVSVRFDVQTKIEGVVTMFAGVIAGGLLWLIDAFAIVDRIYFTYFLIPVILCWIFVTSKLYNSYRSTLEHTLENINSTATEDVTLKKEQLIDEILKAKLRSDNPRQVVQTIKLIENLETGIQESVMKEVQRNHSPEVQPYLQNTVNFSVDTNADDTHTPLQIDRDENIIPEIKLDPALAKDTSFQSAFKEVSSVIKLARSRNKTEKIKAARLLGESGNGDNIFLLIELLRDADPEVCKSAIAAARVLKRPETWPQLIELLVMPACGYAASMVIIEAGEKAVPVLELAFQKNSQHIQLLSKIIQIFGQIGGEKATELLWNKIEYPDAEVVTQALLALSKCQHQASAEMSVTVNRLVEEEIGKAAWNQAALLEIADTDYNIYLKAALEQEMDYNFDRIFILLSLIYNPQSIQLVKNNIDSGTSEGKVYALELLDVFLAKNLKPILFPLLDDIPASEELGIYQAYFPREKLDAVAVLKHIVNREYACINRWTKTCALYSLAMTPGIKVSNALVAHIFNQDALLRETAAWAIHTISPHTYHEITSRLSNQVKIEFEIVNIIEVVDPTLTSANMMVSKVLFLQQIPMFAQIPGIVLADLADSIKEMPFRKGKTILSKDRSDNIPLYIIAKGTVICHEGENIFYQMSENELFGELLIADFDINQQEITATEDVVLYSLNKEKFYQILSKYPKLVQAFITIINQRSGVQVADQLPV